MQSHINIARISRGETILIEIRPNFNFNFVANLSSSSRGATHSIHVVCVHARKKMRTMKMGGRVRNCKHFIVLHAKSFFPMHSMPFGSVSLFFFLSCSMRELYERDRVDFFKNKYKYSHLADLFSCLICSISCGSLLCDILCIFYCVHTRYCALMVCQCSPGFCFHFHSRTIYDIMAHRNEWANTNVNKV